VNYKEALQAIAAGMGNLSLEQIGDKGVHGINDGKQRAICLEAAVKMARDALATPTDSGRTGEHQMTPDEIRKRIVAGEYNVPFPKEAESDQKVREEWRKAHRRKSEVEFEKDLAEAFGVVQHQKRERLFALAWEHGHASGLSDVLSFYEDFVELVR
jgi:hypothetical protein